MAHLKNAVLLGTAQVVTGLALVNYFRRAFGLSAWLLAVHALVLIALIGASLAVAVAIVTRQPWRGRRSARLAAAVIPGTLMAALLLLYAANFASNMWMATNVTHTLASLWLADWWAGGDILPLPTGMVVTALGAAALLAAACIWAWSRALDGIAHVPEFARRRAVRGLALVTLVAYGVFFQQLSWRTPRSETLSADPILAFLRSSVAVQDDQLLEVVSRLERDEPACRASYAPADTFDRKNVIVIIVDSLRADHMQVYGYARQTTPFLDRLWRNGTLRKIEQASSMCAESNCGILATLFSKRLRHQVPQAFTLYDLLRDRGYDTNFILSGNHDWQGLREMYGHSMTRYFDGQDATIVGRNDDRLIFEGLSTVPDRHTPAFFYFHLMSAHLLGYKQAQFRRFEPSAVKNDWDTLFSGEYDRDTVINNYDNGVLQADAMIESLFDELNRKGYLANSVVAILSDHGEGLGERGPSSFGHVTSLKQEFLNIPLLIYDDSPARYANVAYGTQLDVAPTLVDRLGLPVPACWEGQSLLSRPEPAPLTFHQTRLSLPCYAITDRSQVPVFKYSYCTAGRFEELYDLTHDQAERHNLIDTAEASRTDRYRAMLREWRAE